MQRVKRSTAVAVLPAAPAGGSPGYFAAPNPGGGVPATVPGHEWYNGIQEELMAVIEGQGLAGSSTDHTLLRQAILKMVQAGQRAVIINNAVFAGAVTGAGKAVYWDSANSRFDLALSDGSVKQNAVGFADVPNGNVYAFGDAVLFSGLTPGSRYYLDGTTAGVITTMAPASGGAFVGIARTATELFVDIDPVAATNLGQQPGEICYFPRSTAPTGFLKANGAAISRTTYAALFAVIGNTFGAGDGSTTFNIPDLRGEFLRGFDDGRGLDSGRVNGSLQLDAMQGHFHSGSLYIVNTSLGGGSGGAQTSGANTGGPVSDGTNGTPRTAAETRPRNVAMLACIKY